ncbi:MAG: Rrf2 family transcriptional regulator [Planctomycetes bacterium]|nr:Rrf2 family transcriptional regulator [Planctomycetota bacterium]
MTRKTDYALLAMAELARRTPTMLSVREMSQHLRLPLPALTNILKQLTRSGLVSSTRGPNGGYRLARDSDRITLTFVRM